MGLQHEALPWIKIFPSPEMLAMTGRMTDGAKSPFFQRAPGGPCLCPLFTVLARPVTPSGSFAKPSPYLAI